MKRLLYILIVFTCFLNACKQEYVGQPGTDSIVPGKITNPVVENLPGGARITYDLPDDDDLLYVNAVYIINGKEVNTSASMYKNEVTVEGFGTTDEQKIKLYCIDRSNNISEPVEVAIHPTTPPVQLIYETLKMKNDFGGVQLEWENKTESDIAIYLIAADSVGDLNVADVVYTSTREGKYSLRGFDDEERVFGAFVRDRWDNLSDTLSGIFTPIYEMKLDKSKWKREVLMGDIKPAFDYGGSWIWSKMFDEIMADQGWTTRNVLPPVYITIDLGAEVKLSRYTLWHRLGSWPYKHFNPKYWDVYGTTSPKFEIYDEDYWTGDGFKKDWTLLLNCYSYKPSGENTPITNEDREYAANGFEFTFPLDAPPVRYLRFHFRETWGGGSDIMISEISCWGKIVKE